MEDYTQKQFEHLVKKEDHAWFDNYEILWYRTIPNRNLAVTIEKDIRRETPFVVCRYSTITFALIGARELHDFDIETFYDFDDYEEIQKQFLFYKIKSPLPTDYSL
jgi:hypothetical protein